MILTTFSARGSKEGNLIDYRKRAYVMYEHLYNYNVSDANNGRKKCGIERVHKVAGVKSVVPHCVYVGV